MPNTCIIVGAADFDPARFCEKKEGDLLIAADGGLRHLQKAKLSPDFFIGDLDSVHAAPALLPRRILPTVKDDTDLVAACRYGLEKGYTHFLLYGVLGGNRPSHSLAALQTLAFLREAGAKGEICDRRCHAFALKEEAMCFGEKASGFFSLFSLAEGVRVSIAGAKYELDHAALSPSFPLGVSNEFCHAPCKITVHSGTCLLLLEEA